MHYGCSETCREVAVMSIVDAIEGDVDLDELASLIQDGGTLADAVALWNALENPREMVDDYRSEPAHEVDND
jgi:hypothetical protein